jgi:serine/threonine protein kinase
MAKSIESARPELSGGPSDGRPRPEEIAAQYLAEQSTGSSPDIERFLARLPDEQDRREFRELVDGAARAVRGLPRTLAPGSVIAGRYRITGKIGDGGMSTVYAAHDEKLRRDVAVKVLAPLAQGNRDHEKLLDEEWRILAELNHPGIVAVHDAGNDDGLTYIVMDLVDGTAMSDVVENAGRAIAGGAARNGALLARAIGKPTSPGRGELLDPGDWSRSVARIVLEIARTLEAAHGKHVIHRDLKPGNVMLLGGGAPIVLDFGLAGSARTPSGDGRLHGSLPYVAPEQVESESQGMDPRTDVYQIGLLLYELLTLRRAFPGAEPGDVLRRIRQGYFERPRKIERSIPLDLEAICMKAVEVDLARRYQSARELREDLEAWLDGRVPVASRDARWRSMVRTAKYTARRHPALTTLAAMLLVGVVTWAFVATSDPGRETNFFRMVPQGKKDFRIVPIRDRKEEVATGDLLGFALRDSRDVEVYALSMYGSMNGVTYLSPWKATDKDHLERLKEEKLVDPAVPFGFHVPPHEEPVTQIVGTWLRKDSAGHVNQREGLLVLVAHDPSAGKKLEAWMGRLQDAEAGGDVPWDRAMDLLTPPTTRGGGLHSAPLDEYFDRDVLDGLRKALDEEDKKAVHRLRLPGVEDYSIECRVAGT